ncbi:InlB B-repeat-containing protein [Listeria monocytogenes]
MNKRKKPFDKLVVALLLLCTIGLPIQNIVLANELSTTEEVITEEVEINEDKTIASEEAEQPTEEITDSKEEKSIEKNVKAISSDKISVIFPDVALAEIICAKLGKNSVDDVVTQAELNTILQLSVKSKGRVDLSGVENLTSLNSLVLNEVEISDLSPVKDLKSLSNFQGTNCGISDLSSLSNLTSLRSLYLENNNISDVSPLANLTGLVFLRLDGNEINDISNLSRLVGLGLLYLGNNQISDISPLKNLKSLTSISIENQTLTLPSVKWNSPLNVTNSLKDVQGNLVVPSSISNQGAYTAPTITWTGLANLNQSVNYSWKSSLPIGNVKNVDFSGTVNMQVNRVENNVNFDIDGQVTTESVGAGELVTKPQDPNKDGYAFIGWYDTETGGTKWDFTTNTMPPNDITLYARFNKLGFVTPEIKPAIPTIVTPITPGVDPITPSVEPPATPSGKEGNQTPSNDSGLTTVNTGNTTITSQEDTVTSSPTTSQESKLAKLGENNSLLLQGFGLLLVLSGVAFFLVKRRKTHS